MIAHDISAKNKKTLRKSLVQVPVVKESEESDSKEFEDSDAEKAGTDSPNEEIENRKNISTDDQTSSGVEGDESDANEDVNESNNINDKSNANPHWADAMKKILNTKKPKRKKTIVLSKAKKLNDIVSKPKEIVVPFEIETKEGKIKKETIKIEEKTIEQSENNIKQKEQRRKNIVNKIRVKPSVLDKEYEKRLQKIATNGVVQLFNAVRQQQKEIQDKLIEAGPLERKREKALKSINRKAFLDVLMGGTNNIVDDSKESNNDEHPSSNKKDDEVWSVLRDDFVMGAKLKDWNKHNTSDEESSAPEEMDSD